MRLSHNVGTFHARNIGALCALGKYISFLDADDYLDKTMCELSYSAITSDSNIDIVAVDMAVQNADSSYAPNALYAKDCIIDISAFAKMIVTSKRWHWQIPAKLISKATYYEALRLCEVPQRLISAEDTLQCMLLLLESKRIALLSKALYYYRHSEIGITKTQMIDKIKLVIDNHAYIIEILNHLIATQSDNRALISLLKYDLLCQMLNDKRKIKRGFVYYHISSVLKKYYRLCRKFWERKILAS